MAQRRKRTGSKAKASEWKGITKAQWELLVESYGTYPGQHTLVAKVVGLPERTCRTAWSEGLRSLDFGATAIRVLVEGGEYIATKRAQILKAKRERAAKQTEDLRTGNTVPASEIVDAIPPEDEFIITGEVTEADVERVRRRLLQNRMLDADALHGATGTTRELWAEVGTLKKPLRLLTARIGKSITEMAGEKLFDLKEGLLILKFFGEYVAKLSTASKSLGEAQAAALEDARHSLDTGELRPKDTGKEQKTQTPEELIAQMNAVVLDVPRQLARLHQKLEAANSVGVPGGASAGAKPPVAAE